jgi:hypothetical protein
MQQNLDERLFSLISDVEAKHAFTASDVAYYHWYRTGGHNGGENVDEQVFADSLERLFAAGRIQRKENYRHEFAYYGRETSKGRNRRVPRSGSDQEQASSTS